MLQEAASAQVNFVRVRREYEELQAAHRNLVGHHQAERQRFFSPVLGEGPVILKNGISVSSQPLKHSKAFFWRFPPFLILICISSSSILQHLY